MSKTHWTRHPMFASLTEQQRKVAGAAAEGWTNAAIAAKLGMTISAVQSTLSVVYRKTNLSDRDAINYESRARLTNLIVRAELMTHTKVLL